MTIQIHLDSAVRQELAGRGVDLSVGIFACHYVQLGKASLIRLDEIDPAKVPAAWLKEVAQVSNGMVGGHTPETTLTILSTAGELDAEALLCFLKAGQTHPDRLAKINAFNRQIEDELITQARKLRQRSLHRRLRGRHPPAPPDDSVADPILPQCGAVPPVSGSLFPSATLQ